MSAFKPGDLVMIVNGSGAHPAIVRKSGNFVTATDLHTGPDDIPARRLPLIDPENPAHVEKLARVVQRVRLDGTPWESLEIDVTQRLVGEMRQALLIFAEPELAEPTDLSVRVRAHGHTWAQVEKRWVSRIDTCKWAHLTEADDFEVIA